MTTDRLVEAELGRALAAPGCVICRVSDGSATHYLGRVLTEGVNDVGTRARLDRSWGFCRRHAWKFVGLERASAHDNLSAATLAGDLLAAVLRAVDLLLAAPSTGRRSAAARAAVQRTLTPAGRCPACEVQREHAAYATLVLLRALADPGWRRTFERSAGLCLPHFRGALAADVPSEQLRWVAEDEARRLRALTADLDEYGRKHDHQFTHEAYGPEADIALRATTALAGSGFGLPDAGRAISHESNAHGDTEDESHGRAGAKDGSA